MAGINRQAVFAADGGITIRETTVPRPGPGEAVLRVKACGVCGSDVTCHASGLVGDGLLGHEYAGEVTEVHPGVTEVKPGDRVAGIGSWPCGQCSACSRDPRNCLHPKGCKADAFADYVLRPAGALFRAPSLTFEEGALIEPLTVAMELVRDGRVELGSTVGIMGLGPIGLMTARVAELAGARRVYGFHPSSSSARSRAASEWGIDEPIPSDTGNPSAALRDLEPDGLDCVLITAPPSRTIPLAVELAVRGGTIAFVGVEFKTEVAMRLPMDALHGKRISLKGSDHNPCKHLYPLAANLLQSKSIRADYLVSHRFPLSRISQAFALLDQRREALKVMILPAEKED